MGRSSWDIQKASIGNLDSSEQAKSMLWARAKALGLLCESANNSSRKNVFGHMSTAVAARDMLALIDAIEAHRLAVIPVGPLQQQILPQPNANEQSSFPKLIYWGRSYGTFLGETFASMYPERVERMVRVGVIDADDYIANGWKENLRDSEAVMKYFYQTCFDAGPAAGSLFDPNGPQAIEMEVGNILERVKGQPIATL